MKNKGNKNKNFIYIIIIHIYIILYIITIVNAFKLNLYKHKVRANIRKEKNFY